MANAKDFLLPDLGEGLTEGEIVSWLVAVGDSVEVDQPVAEVETAKAVVEVPSPFAGTVLALHGEPGQEVEVGKPLVTIDLDGRPAPDAGAAEAEPTDAATRPGGTIGGSSEDAEVADMVPQPTEEADDSGSGNVLVGYGTGGGRSKRRRGGEAVTAPAAGAPPAAPQRPAPRAAPRSGSTLRTGRPLAKPPVRKLAKDKGVDLAMVAGSGPDGIITRDDIEQFLTRSPGGNGEAAPATVPPSEDYQQLLASEVPASGAPPFEAPGADLVTRIPVKGVRKAVARQMTISRQQIPEATTWVDVDATELWALRQDLIASQSEVKVSPLAIIMRACVAGLRDFPEVNARLDTETNEIVLQHFVNLGFAAQTDSGLMVPVIKRADQLSTLGIASELNRLATAARDRSVKPDEMTGGTFTLSNYGTFGVDGGSAVINWPEAAILGVGRIIDRPWVVDGTIQVRKVQQLSIAFDHRICDGGEAAGFLRFVADCIESPTKLLASL
ncbi:MAG: 2-oxo acid dehydrogenase subunit E2 [Nitriliruptorales bacterium]|nr:2-oxo acid dehydrogenase subunit E2 [Nitriliruptorales bacterium]